MGERTFWVGGSGFWQVHPAAASLLTASVLHAVQARPDELALDLYAGVGLFSAALAAEVGEKGEVFAVEGAPGSVADARVNLRDLPQVRVHEGRVDTVLAALGLGRVDVVVLDPPRTGAGARTVELVAALQPRRIAYVACDPGLSPATCARSRGPATGWTACARSTCSPMTHHVECVATITPA